MGANGINLLLAVCQQKQDVANDNALNGAKKQSDLVKKEQQVHDIESQLEDMVQSKEFSTADRDRMINIVNNSGLDPAVKSQLLGGRNSLSADANHAGHFHLDDTGGRGGDHDNYTKINALKDAFHKMDTDLSNQDKLGNFQVQSLMSDYNEAQTLASSVQKKLDDTKSAVIGKI
jgi:hypothetical protein